MSRRALLASIAEEFEKHPPAPPSSKVTASRKRDRAHVGPLDGSAIRGTIGLPISDTDAAIVDAGSGRRSSRPAASGSSWSAAPRSCSATGRPRGDGRSPPGRLAAHRRPRDLRRTRLLPDRRPQGPHHHLRVQRLPGRRRGGAAELSGVKDAAVVGVPDDQQGEVVARRPGGRIGEGVPPAGLRRVHETETGGPLNARGSSRSGNTTSRGTSSEKCCGANCGRALPAGQVPRDDAPTGGENGKP